MKKLLIGLSFLTLTFNAFALTPQKIYEDSVKAILYLKNQDVKGKGFNGTGFFMKEGNEIFLVTNNHMVQDPNDKPQKEAKEIDVSKMIGFSKNMIDDPKNNRNYSGFRLLYTDPVADIAILKVPNTQEIDNYLELAGSDENLMVGDDSFWIGHPGGLWSFTFSRGYIGKIERNGNSYDLQLHGVGFHGSSGSPFLNNEGKVIGILATGNYKTEKILLASPNSEEMVAFDQKQEYEEVQFGPSKVSILKALEKAKANDTSEPSLNTQNVNRDFSKEIKIENTELSEPQHDLASLIRELKAYTPPEERKLGSL